MALTQDEAEAVQRLRDAVKDRPGKGYVGVTAGDVLVAAALVPEAERTGTIKDTIAGAMANRPEEEIFQEAGKLRALLEKVAEPPPIPEAKKR